MANQERDQLIQKLRTASYRRTRKHLEFRKDLLERMDKTSRDAARMHASKRRIRKSGANRDKS